MIERLYTPQEVKEVLRKKSIKTIYRYIRNGKLKAKKIDSRLYIEESELRDFLEIPEEEQETK